MDDQVTADDYSDPMSERLLGSAADVLRSFGGAFGGRHLAIVGGAVPSLLVARSLRASSDTLALPTWPRPSLGGGLLQGDVVHWVEQPKHPRVLSSIGLLTSCKDRLPRPPTSGLFRLAGC